MLLFHMVSAANITEMPKQQNDSANEMLQEVKRALTESIHWRETGGRGKKQTNSFWYVFPTIFDKTKNFLYSWVKGPHIFNL